MRLIYCFLLFAACSTDVSIMKHQNSEPATETGSPASDTNSPSEPTNEPVDDPPLDSEMTELTIGNAEIHFRQIACPACVGEPSEFSIDASLVLHYPTSGNYTEYLTATGTCSTNLYETHVSNEPLVSSQAATFNNIILNPAGQGIWTNSNLYEYQYQRNTVHDISTEHGLIPSAFISIEGFDSIEPYTLLWVDPSYAFDAVISKSGTSFTWSPVIQNSLFEIIVAVYSPDGSQFLGAVSCMENDVGYMQIPGSYFQSYPTWSLAAVHLIRHRIDRQPAELYNGWLESHMQWEVVGTGHIE